MMDSPPAGRDTPQRPDTNDSTLLRAPAEANPAGREAHKAEESMADKANVAENVVQAAEITWQASEQASILWEDYSSFDPMACLTMLDHLQLLPHDLAMTSMIDVDTTTLPPEHYKDQFSNPMSDDEAWNIHAPSKKKNGERQFTRNLVKLMNRRFGKCRRSLLS